MRFFLFILANAMLFIRPSELLPEAGDFELYRYVIFLCLLVSAPVVLHQIFARVNGMPPIVGCVLGLLPAGLMSHIVHGNGEEALVQGIEMLKVLVYFLLLIGLVTSITRLRQLLFWLSMFCAVLAVVAVLRYHVAVTDPATPPKTEVTEEEKGKKKINHGEFVVDKARDPETGELVDVQRMCGTGIFNDPNDLALVLVTALPICCYWLTDPSRKATRPLWLGLILVFGYALVLTQSRGGLLAMMAGICVFLQLRFGGAKMLIGGLLVMPLILAVFAGRMTTMSASEGTGQSRIQIWADGMMMLQQSPLFGVGMEEYKNNSSHVAHNSYIHCYAELGILGGTLFLGAFYFALDGLYRLRYRPQSEPEAEDGYNDETLPCGDPGLRRLHPYLMAMLASYAVGIFFLSRSYVVPTYLLLGLAVAYLRMRSDSTTPAWCKTALVRLAGVSVCFVIGAYVFVRMFVNWH